MSSNPRFRAVLPRSNAVRIGAALVVAVFVRSAAADTTHSFPAPGEWPAFRRNPSLDARSPLAGPPSEPRVLWQHYLGLHEETLVLVPSDSGPIEISVPATEWPAAGEESDLARWGLASPRGEVEGKQQAIPLDAFRTYADVLPDSPGLEKFEVFREGTAACFRWEAGVWREVWRSAPMDFGNSVTTNPMVGDFDGDGAPELAFLPWWHLVMLDARTGALKHLCKFAEGRSYGYFGAHDLDRDGKSEFVVQGDFAKHVDVLGWREGALSVLWQRNIEPDISNPQAILRVYANVVADTGGDGALEVLMNTFNHEIAHRWAVSVLDGLTGNLKCVIPDAHLNDLVDLDADGAAELLVTRAEGVLVPEFGAIAVVRAADETPETAWETPDAAWVTWEPPLPLSINSGATFGRRRVLARDTADGIRVVMRRRSSSSVREHEVEVCAWQDNALRAELSATGEDLTPRGLDKDGALLLRALVRPNASTTLRVSGAHVRPAASRPLGCVPGVVAFAAPPGGNAAYIAVQGCVEANHGGGELVLLRCPTDGSEPDEVRRIQGRGQSSGWPQHFGPAFADLRGDGARQLLYAARGSGGCARLVAEELDGSVFWAHDFENIPGTAPVWNSGGLLLWQTGHFTDLVRADVLISIRRSMMHSEETVLLSGANGRELWRCSRQNSPMHSRGVGGTHFALADADGDGLDDVGSFYPSLFFILEGSTGANLILKDAAWDAVKEKPIYYGRAVAVPGTDNSTAFFMAGTGLTALVKVNGELVWADESGKTSGPFAFPKLKDNAVAVGFGFDDGARCYRPADGSVLWRSDALPAGTTEVATMDIGGDSEDEIIASAGSKLVCVRSSDGAVLWERDLQTPLGPPSLVQLGDKPAELIQGADGWLYAIGNS